MPRWRWTREQRKAERDAVDAAIDSLKVLRVGLAMEMPPEFFAGAGLVKLLDAVARTVDAVADQLPSAVEPDGQEQTRFGIVAPSCESVAWPHVHTDCLNPDRRSVRRVCVDCRQPTMHGPRCPSCVAGVR